MAKHYYISFNGSDFSEIFPMGSPVATMREEEGTHVWREEVDKMKLLRSNNTTVYDTLESYFTDKTKFDTELEIEIYTGLRATGTLYWSGIFSISDSTIDMEMKSFEIKPRINDSYRTIMEKAETQYLMDSASINILEQLRIGYAEQVTIGTSWTNGTPGGMSTYSTLTALSGEITSAISTGIPGDEGAWVLLPALANNDILIVDISAYTLAAGADPEFEIFYGGASDTSMTDEGRQQVATGLLAWTISTGQASPRLTYISESSTSSMSFTVRKVAAANDHSSSATLLMDFVEEVLTDSKFMYLTGYTGNVVSTFINNDTLPTGAPTTIGVFMAAYPNGNYADGGSTNKLNNVLVGLMRKWFTSVGANSLKMSFNDVMNGLRDIFQAYWFIDADGKFRIEHESYFVAAVNDSTPIVVPASGEISKRKLTYEKGLVAFVEQFSMAQAENSDFIGNDIIYNNFETTDNIKSYSVSNFTTDMGYVMGNIDQASDSGLGLFHCELLDTLTGDNMYAIAYATGALSSQLKCNAELSWANLHEAYWTWSRMAEDATMNGTGVTMDSGVRFLLQEGVRFFYSTAINPFTSMTTTLTGGAPVEIQRSLDTDYIEMIIGYDPYKL